MKKLSAIILLLFLSLSPIVSSAQCSMCSATAKNGATGEVKRGSGINKGIYVLVVMPYLAAAVVGGIWYRNSRRNNE